MSAIPILLQPCSITLTGGVVSEPLAHAVVSQSITFTDQDVTFESDWAGEAVPVPVIPLAPENLIIHGAHFDGGLDLRPAGPQPNNFATSLSLTLVQERSSTELHTVGAVIGRDWEEGVRPSLNSEILLKGAGHASDGLQVLNQANREIGLLWRLNVEKAPAFVSAPAVAKMNGTLTLLYSTL